MPDSLSSWLEHIERIHPKTIEMGLDRLIEVRRRMGLHPSFSVVTVGGTNGKGSTCAMLESILHHSGYKVGCYTSPHLIRFNERMRIGKIELEDDAITKAFCDVEAARGEIRLTYFEFSTLAAVKCFIDSGIDIAVLEVGLGGRLDAVNLFDADCAVITAIDLDHMDYLGENREAIGFEKAGILRKGKPGVCSDPDLPESVLNHARNIGARLLRIGQDFGYRRHADSWDYHGERERKKLPFPGLKGEFQLMNASTALAALDALGIPVDDTRIAQGLTDLDLPGRFQVLGRAIVDVAHNPQAARMLAMNLEAMPSARTVAIFGMLCDKDIEGVVRELKGKMNEWLIVKLDVPRGADTARLGIAFEREGVEGFRAFCSVSAAWDHACATSGENDRIVVFGSFYTVADFMRLIPPRRD